MIEGFCYSRVIDSPIEANVSTRGARSRSDIQLFGRWIRAFVLRWWFISAGWASRRPCRSRHKWSSWLNECSHSPDIVLNLFSTSDWVSSVAWFHHFFWSVLTSSYHLDYPWAFAPLFNLEIQLWSECFWYTDKARALTDATQKRKSFDEQRLFERKISTKLTPLFMCGTMEWKALSEIKESRLAVDLANLAEWMSDD